MHKMLKYAYIQILLMDFLLTRSAHSTKDSYFIVPYWTLRIFVYTVKFTLILRPYRACRVHVHTARLFYGEGPGCPFLSLEEPLMVAPSGSPFTWVLPMFPTSFADRSWRV